MPRRVFPTTPKVDLGALGLTIHNALRSDVTGYILHVRRKGKLVHVGRWNWAQTPADRGKGWTRHTQMHLSVDMPLLRPPVTGQI